jgi:hypothetical protein
MTGKEAVIIRRSTKKKEGLKNSWTQKGSDLGEKEGDL